MTQETKRAIYEDYLDRTKKLKDIAEKHGVRIDDVSRTAIAQGAERRRTFAPRKAREKVKTCPKCHRKIALSDAKFCCYCGADMRTEKDRLIERLHKGMEAIMLLPSEARDEVQRLLIDVEKEIRKGE